MTILLLLAACAKPQAALGPLGPDPLVLSGLTGETVGATLAFQNEGEADLAYAASEEQPWLRITSGAAGSVPPQSDAAIGLEATCPATPSAVEGVVTVTAEAEGSPRRALVRLTCTGLPELGEPAPNPLELAADVDQSVRGAVTFGNAGTAPLVYSASESASWLEIASGATGTVAPLSAARLELEGTCPDVSGLLEAEVALTTNDPADPSKSILVKLNCAGPEIDTPAPDPLELSAAVRETASGAVSFGNSGNADLRYSARAESAWLSVVSGGTGVVAPGAKAEVGLEARCSGTPGSFSGALVIASNDPDEPEKRVTVSLACERAIPDITGPEPNPLLLRAGLNEAATGTLSFKNVGAGSLDYGASAVAAWLEIVSGQTALLAPDEEAAVTVRASCSDAPNTLSSSIEIRSDDPDEPLKTVTVQLTCVRDGGSAFDLEVRFLGEGFTEARRAVFLGAAARWSELIQGDLPDTPVAKAANDCGYGYGEPALNERIDDLLIHAIITYIDGPGNVLGSAGPCVIRNEGDRLPVYGVMRFDSADVASMEADGSFDDVILHEMGHVLGIGTYWDFGAALGVNYLDYETVPAGLWCAQATQFAEPPTFNGEAAAAEFASLGARGQPPAEDQYGSGTKCAHWDEEIFGSELMTGYVNLGGPMPLSRLTGASLEDIGYQVDLNGADAYALPACSPACVRASALEPGWEEVTLPRFAVDLGGGLVSLEPARQR